MNKIQVACLNAAIAGYKFPAVYFDFSGNMEVAATSMMAVEAHIHGQLTSAHQVSVVHGLANVIYWGYAQIGYRDFRVGRFMREIKSTHVVEFQKMVAGGVAPTMCQIKDIRMPEFSGVSFISKILAFLKPVSYCVLDQQISRIGSGNGPRALNILGRGPQLRITAKNQAVYDLWRNECTGISTAYFGGAYRAIDVERGFFHLVQTGQLKLAQTIYADA